MPDDRTDWFGDVGPGWRPLLDELHTELLRRWPHYEIHQVKEKFGTLRFYAAPGPYPHLDGEEDESEAQQAAHHAWHKDFGETVLAYEKRSAQICEECGAPGALRKGPWAKTHCDVHHLAHEHRALTGYHAEEWNRFVISAPSFSDAARVAAHLGWWLHCWNWQEGPWSIVDTAGAQTETTGTDAPV